MISRCVVRSSERGGCVDEPEQGIPAADGPVADRHRPVLVGLLCPPVGSRAEAAARRDHVLRLPAGLHFLVPVLNDVRKFDGGSRPSTRRPNGSSRSRRRTSSWTPSSSGASPTSPVLRATGGGNAARAERLLGERINTRLRDEFGKRTIQEVVSGERGEIMTLLTKDADERAAELGIEVVDVRVKRIDLPAEVSESVYERMRPSASASRATCAPAVRRQPSASARRRPAADRDRRDAYRESEVLRGEGDAKSAQVYAEAFQKNSESTRSGAAWARTGRCSKRVATSWCSTPTRTSSVT